MTPPIRARDVNYLNAVQRGLNGPLRRVQQVADWLTATCPECDADLSQRPGWHPAGQWIIDGHIVVGRYLTIGCRGYWVIDPNAVGMDSPDWHDWTTDLADLPPAT